MYKEQQTIELPCGCKGTPCITGGIDISYFCAYHYSLTGCKNLLMKKQQGS